MQQGEQGSGLELLQESGRSSSRGPIWCKVQRLRNTRHVLQSASSSKAEGWASPLTAVSPSISIGAWCAVGVSINFDGKLSSCTL